MKLKKNIFLIILLPLFNYNLVDAQNIVNDSVLKITYIKYNQNPPSPRSEHQEYLVVNGNKSYYFNYMKAADKNGKIPVPDFVLKERDSNKLFFGSIMFPQYPIGSFWSDTLAVMKWQIAKEYKSIKNVLCQKATTYFRGRYYTAYFAPSIPISDGPYKFCGLPGLIMNIKDSKGNFEFEVDKIEKIANIYLFKLGPVYGDYDHHKQLYKTYFTKQEEKRKARQAADPNCLDCGNDAVVRYTFLEEIFD